MGLQQLLELLYGNGQLVWTPALGLFCEGGREDVSPDVHVTSNVELRNNVGLLLNVELRNYVISRQIVCFLSDCYLNIVVSLDCY